MAEIVNTASATEQAIFSLNNLPSQSGRLLLCEIVDAVCLIYGIGKNDITSGRRVKKVCEARHVYFWVARKFTTYSFPQIGKHCGDKDHSTVMHGVTKIDLHFPEYRERIGYVLEALGIDSEVAA
jgi:chromosomal replication initiator protein